MAISFGVQGAVSEHLSPLSRPSGRLWTHSSLRLHVQRSFAHHPQVGQRKQRHQIGRVLCQPPVLDLDVTELPLDDPKRVFHLGSNAGLGLLQLLQDGAHRRVLVQCLALAGHHGDVPVHTRVLSLNFFALLDAPVARVGKDIGFFTVQQSMGLSNVMGIGCGSRHAVHQARVCIHTGMRFHAVVPLVSLLGLVHLRVTGTSAVLGGCRHSNQRGIHHRTLLEQQTLGAQRGVDGGQDLDAQVVGLQQVAEPKDGALVGQVVFAHVQAGKVTKHGCVVQRLLHGRVRQVEPLLKEVDAKHGLHSKRRAASFGAARRRVWSNQRHQLSPRNHQVHLVQELALACPLGLALESSGV